MATATVEFNVNIKKIFEYLKQNISTKNSEAVRDIEKIQDYIKKTTDEYVLEIMNDKNEAHMFMMFMEYALNCTEDKKKIDNLSNDIEYNKVKECYNKMYIKMTETNKDFNQVYSYLHSVLEKPSGLVNSSGKAKVSKTQLKAVLHSHEVGDFDFSSPPGLAPGFAAPRDTTLGATSSAHVYNTDQYGNFMPLGWTYQKINNLDTYTFKYDGEEEIIQYISPNGDNIYYKPGTNQEFIRKDLNKRGVYTEIPANIQIKTKGQTKGNTKGHTTTIMDQPMMGQPISQPMSGQTMSGQTMMELPITSQLPMMGNSMMGPTHISSQKGKKGKPVNLLSQQHFFQPNPQGYQPNPQGYQPNPQFSQPKSQFSQPNPQGFNPNPQGFQTQHPGLSLQPGFRQGFQSQQQSILLPIGTRICHKNGGDFWGNISSYDNNDNTYVLDTVNKAQTAYNKIKMDNGKNNWIICT